jgi:hypothetical protein
MAGADRILSANIGIDELGLRNPDSVARNAEMGLRIEARYLAGKKQRHSPRSAGGNSIPLCGSPLKA